ncbi:hypothetical protein NDU88_007108 [Pleurodeles waltl]|uniref:Uncharacterized protein n=1 Tax=Pleurodeles waltl TaxID=8319 RepID=A0AAV7TYT3_PLEWA|nr:hypothetical protein NDU88_007108 [Pleurodeles waltl]
MEQAATAIPIPAGRSALSLLRASPALSARTPRSQVILPSWGGEWSVGASETLRWSRGAGFAVAGLRFLTSRDGPSREPALGRTRHLGLRRPRGTPANSSTAAASFRLISIPLKPGGSPVLGTCFFGLSGLIKSQDLTGVRSRPRSVALGMQLHRLLATPPLNCHFDLARGMAHQYMLFGRVPAGAGGSGV